MLRQPSIDDCAHGIGLGSGRPFFGRVRPKERTHSGIGFLSPTGSTTVTGHRGVSEFAWRPFQLQFHKRCGDFALRTKVIDSQVRIVAENLIGIEQMIWIKEGLNLLKNSIEFPILRLEEGCSRETKAMLTADRSTDRNCRVIEVSREIFQKRRVEWRRQKRTHVKLTDRSMGVERGSYLMFLPDAPCS